MIENRLTLLASKKKIRIPMLCRSLVQAAYTELPGFPFTVILPIYDIVDLYSYIALKPNVRWKTVLIKGPCKVAAGAFSSFFHALTVHFQVQCFAQGQTFEDAALTKTREISYQSHLAMICCKMT